MASSHSSPRTSTPSPDVSVVLPIYNERENIEPLLGEIEAALASIGKTYEVIAVDDGSTDGTAKILDRLSRERSSLRVVFFRRNAGQSAAFDAGFRYASGAVVVTMDADRQNDPKDIGPMLALLEEGHDLVSGWRKDRKDGLFLRKVPSKIANYLIRRVTGTKLHDMGCSLKVYRREITDELNLYGESHRFLPVLAEHVGARTTECIVHHRPRVAGKSKYGLTRTFKVMLDLFSIWYMRGYQTRPIYVFGGTAIVLFVFAVLASGVVLYEKWAEGAWVHRNPLFILSMVAALTTVQLLSMGLISETMMRTYFESQKRPPYFVARTAGFAEEKTQTNGVSREA